ncbi:MAG: 2-phospho-L-lactate transferase CofD family protein, partial [Actinomycetota bacterium]
DRGWGRADETFHAIEAMRDAGVDAWFALGDRDLGTHLRRTELLRGGATLSEATDMIATAFGVVPRVLPMTDDEVTTRIDVLDPEADGGARDLHFQEYWVRRRAADPVKQVRYTGAARAVAQPAAIEALERAEAIVVCPSNPVASIAPILAVPGYRKALAARREVVVGISPIVAGAPLAGMADRLMPVAGLEVSALGAAQAYEGLLGSWILDERDRGLAGRIEHELGLRTAATDTIMVDDARAGALARIALSLAREQG